MLVWLQRRWRLSDEPWVEADGEELRDPAARAKVKATIFFSYTSNMISSGNREVIRFLCQHKMVDLIVTTGGGIEEDFLKCAAPHYMGDFALKGATLRKQGLNRIGNLIVPNKNYCLFEDWFAPLLNTMHDEQERDVRPWVGGLHVCCCRASPLYSRVSASMCQGTVWTPSKMIRRMGKEINNEESVYYWCYKNDIPVYCPALTDGSVGDMIFFHSYKRPGFILDIAGDIRGVNETAMKAKRTGMLILGGGLVKHHVCNANLMRNGADWAVFVNTGQEFDGSDSGARPDEAISWGKIKIDSRPVKVYADATLVFPMLVAQTFAKGYHNGEYDSKPAAAGAGATEGDATAGAGAAAE